MAAPQDAKKLDFLINNCLTDTFTDAKIEQQCHQLKMPKGPILAIVIDDVGDGNPSRTDVAINLPGPLTMAFLPASENSRLQEQVRTAYDNGHEVIMHTPMETGDAKYNNGHSRLMTGQSVEEIQSNLWWNKQQFGDAAKLFSGFNNHQGSVGTQDMDLVKPAIEYLDQTTEMSYVLDSKTHHKSVMCDAAGDVNMACVSRDVFLDHNDNIGDIRAKLYEAVDHALETGSAIAIGHHYTDTTLKVLAQELPHIEGKFGVTLVPVSDVVERRLGVDLGITH